MSKWSELIAKIKPGTSRGQRAVHKPLLTLMILSQAQRGGENHFAYSDVHEKLKQAIRGFGPPTKQIHSDYPFWYLQGEGFWSIVDVDKLPRRTGKDQVTHKNLLRHDAVGVVPAGLWSALKRNETIIPTLTQQTLDAFWPDTYHEEIATDLGLDLSGATTKRKRDPKFRGELLVAYQRQCAVCGYNLRVDDHLVGLEAAHIFFVESGGPDAVENGLLLCSLHHKTFDWGAIGLDTDLRIKVSQRISGGDAALAETIPYNGRRIIGPQPGCAPPNPKYIDWHNRKVFGKPARPFA